MCLFKVFKRSRDYFHQRYQFPKLKEIKSSLNIIQNVLKILQSQISIQSLRCANHRLKTNLETLFVKILLKSFLNCWKAQKLAVTRKGEMEADQSYSIESKLNGRTPKKRVLLQTNTNIVTWLYFQERRQISSNTVIGSKRIWSVRRCTSWISYIHFNYPILMGSPVLSFIARSMIFCSWILSARTGSFSRSLSILHDTVFH